ITVVNETIYKVEFFMLNFAEVDHLLNLTSGRVETLPTSQFTGTVCTSSRTLRDLSSFLLIFVVSKSLIIISNTSVTFA
ncbi:MAG: hypothetical protein ACO3EJ_09040, partial [Ilumatobacteraceae bacterium]